MTATTQTLTPPASTSSAMLWTGRVITGLVALFLLFDSVIKLIEMDVVRESMFRLGYPASLSGGRLLGMMEFCWLVLYVTPRTSVLGAILLTGHLGGAIASHVRVGDPLFTHVLFGVYLGILAWGGLYLRDEKLRRMIPLRRD